MIWHSIRAASRIFHTPDRAPRRLARNAVLAQCVSRIQHWGAQVRNAIRPGRGVTDMAAMRVCRACASRTGRRRRINDLVTKP